MQIIFWYWFAINKILLLETKKQKLIYQNIEINGSLNQISKMCGYFSINNWN